MHDFQTNNQTLLTLIKEWEPKLKALSADVITLRRNVQNRSIKQILGHMIDSASNNTHRIIHLQYQPDPMIFPDYANLGNNDRWIAVQNYQDENWEDLIQLWKYSNYHLVHVINNVNSEKLKNSWISALGQLIPLETMILDYLSHFKLHLKEIDALINES